MPYAVDCPKEISETILDAKAHEGLVTTIKPWIEGPRVKFTQPDMLFFAFLWKNELLFIYDILGFVFSFIILFLNRQRFVSECRFLKIFINFYFTGYIIKLLARTFIHSYEFFYWQPYVAKNHDKICTYDETLIPQKIYSGLTIPLPRIYQMVYAILDVMTSWIYNSQIVFLLLHRSAILIACWKPHQFKTFTKPFNVVGCYSVISILPLIVASIAKILQLHRQSTLSQYILLGWEIKLSCLHIIITIISLLKIIKYKSFKKTTSFTELKGILYFSMIPVFLSIHSSIMRAFYLSAVYANGELEAFNNRLRSDIYVVYENFRQWKDIAEWLRQIEIVLDGVRPMIDSILLLVCFECYRTAFRLLILRRKFSTTPVYACKDLTTSYK